MEEVKRLDKANLIRRRLSAAVVKDTVAVPDGGYVIIRFVADNPGKLILLISVFPGRSHLVLD